MKNVVTKEYLILLEDFFKNNDSAQAHHEEMARSFVKDIALSLKTFDNSQESNQFYNDLAWGGLFKTSYFKDKKNAEKNRIKNVVLIELTGKDSNGDYYSQKGDKSGC